MAAAAVSYNVRRAILLGVNLNPLSRANQTSKSALMFVGVLAASVSLCAWGKLDGGQWVSLMQFALPAFLAAETTAKFAKKETPA